MRKIKNIILGYFLLVLISLSQACGFVTKSKETAKSGQIESNKIKPRTIITTDGESDDQDSFIRLLLYANDMNIEGLVYSSSVFHYKGDGKGTTFTSKIPWCAEKYGTRTDLRWVGTTWMQEFIDKYSEVYSNLMQHDSSYPTPKYLKSIIRVGNIDFEGDMENDTEGSNYIKKLLLDTNDQPIYIQMWGGTNTLARALKSIEEEYKNTPRWSSVYKKVSEKAILYIILDQDATYKRYVALNWPDVKVIYNRDQFWGIAYDGVRAVPETIHNEYLSGDWFLKNIIKNHGALLESYYLWGDGRQTPGDPDHNQGSEEVMKKSGWHKYDFLSEGDSPAFFHLIDFGLNPTENPTFGGLGDRFIKSSEVKNRWEDGDGSADFNPYTQKIDPDYAQTRWIPVLQNDFAARADWAVKNYEDANHPPSIKLITANNIDATSLEKIKLSVNASDPDNDDLNYSWWQYKEAGTYNKSITIINANQKDAEFIVASDIEKGQTIHIILEVKDNGKPQLTRFSRVIVTAKN